jgi:hypothetical protein
MRGAPALREEEVGRYTVELHFDDEPINPRDDREPLGHMVCWHGRYDLGDKHDWKTPADFENWYQAQSQPKVRLPLYLYDHSGLTMNTHGFSCPWDSGQVGYIYATWAALESEYGAPWDFEKEKLALTVLEHEVEDYDRYLRGEYYGYVVVDTKTGAAVHSCWGFDDEDYCWEEGLASANSVLDLDPRKIEDEDAVAEIHKVMDGKEWTPDTLDYIADVIRLTGRDIRDCNEVI